MYHLEVSSEWNTIHSEDLWVYNKLILSRVLGYNCGPAGLSVPKPDFYIVRPSMNLMGMGRFSRIEFIEDSTEHLHPSEFWCEVFSGEHLSVDFRRGIPSLIVKGERSQQNALYKWSRWYKVNREVEFPKMLNSFKETYEWINCEFIDGKLIEVHFRRNSDFRYGNTIAIPVWKGEDMNIDSKYTFVEDEDYHRLGFLIDNDKG